MLSRQDMVNIDSRSGPSSDRYSPILSSKLSSIAKIVRVNNLAVVRSGSQGRIDRISYLLIC